MIAETIGFIGLGAMGGPMSGHLAAAGFDLVVYDVAGTAERAPGGAEQAGSVAEVATAADAVFLSLPDGPISCAVAREIAEAPAPRPATVVDFSTIGIEAAVEAHGILNSAGIAYIDAPVSGGSKGAQAATLAIMWAAPEEALGNLGEAFEAMGRNVFHVGTEPGQAQALKLLNNSLSAVSMAATSEAIAFGLKHGLDMKTMLDVINVSTGQTTASRDKFPQEVLTGSFRAGFATALMAKDLKLYIERARAAGTPVEIGSLIGRIWSDCDAALPESDFTQIYQYVTRETD